MTCACIKRTELDSTKCSQHTAVGVEIYASFSSECSVTPSEAVKHCGSKKKKGSEALCINLYPHQHPCMRTDEWKWPTNRHTRWYGLVHVRSVSDVRGWVDRRPSTTSSLLLLAALNVGSCGGAAGRPPAGQHSVCMVCQCVHCTPTTSRRPASSIAATRIHVRREMW
jgi:hypothetical protein